MSPASCFSGNYFTFLLLVGSHSLIWIQSLKPASVAQTPVQSRDVQLACTQLPKAVWLPLHSAESYDLKFSGCCQCPDCPSPKCLVTLSHVLLQTGVLSRYWLVVLTEDNWENHLRNLLSLFNVLPIIPHSAGRYFLYFFLNPCLFSPTGKELRAWHAIPPFLPSADTCTQYSTPVYCLLRLFSSSVDITSHLSRGLTLHPLIPSESFLSIHRSREGALWADAWCLTKGGHWAVQLQSF